MTLVTGAAYGGQGIDVRKKQDNRCEGACSERARGFRMTIVVLIWCWGRSARAGEDQVC